MHWYHEGHHDQSKNVKEGVGERLSLITDCEYTTKTTLSVYTANRLFVVLVSL